MRWLVPVIALAACGDNLHRFDVNLELVHGCVDLPIGDDGPFLAVDYTLYNDTSASLFVPWPPCCWSTLEARDQLGAVVDRGLYCDCTEEEDPYAIKVLPGQWFRQTPMLVWDLSNLTPSLTDGAYTLRIDNGDGSVSNTITATLPSCLP